MVHSGFGPPVCGRSTLKIWSERLNP